MYVYRNRVKENKSSAKGARFSAAVERGGLLLTAAEAAAEAEL